MTMEVECDVDDTIENLQTELQAGTLAALPGMRLWSASEDYTSGSGTYEDKGYIFSSLVGIVKVTPAEGNKKTVEVIPIGGGAALARTGEIVTAIVARVTDRGARCELRCSGARPLTRPLRAQLLKENVHDKNKDRVDMYKSFRPGDIIIARILPITSLQCYDLATDEPELGVVIAKAADAPPGVNMVPLSWSEMQCPVTLAKEPRKVAKVAPENVRDLIEGNK
ncbi:exosome component 1 Csl4 [Arctopsyche grandis]|uniref:exosome component 1 Csl4 n=1 Tax=Arctopsyche grandis TaxID=121162 RepID=UPI00406DA24C